MSKYRNLSLMATVALLFNSKGALAAENLDEVIEGGLELDEDQRIDPVDDEKFIIEKIYVEKDSGLWTTMLEIDG